MARTNHKLAVPGRNGAQDRSTFIQETVRLHESYLFVFIWSSVLSLVPRAISHPVSLFSNENRTWTFDLGGHHYSSLHAYSWKHTTHSGNHSRFLPQLAAPGTFHAHNWARNFLCQYLECKWSMKFRIASIILCDLKMVIGFLFVRFDSIKYIFIPKTLFYSACDEITKVQWTT